MNNAFFITYVTVSYQQSEGNTQMETNFVFLVSSMWIKRNKFVFGIPIYWAAQWNMEVKCLIFQGAEEHAVGWNWLKQFQNN